MNNFIKKTQIALIIFTFIVLLATFSSAAYAGAPTPTPAAPATQVPQEKPTNTPGPSLSTSLRFEKISLEDGLSQSVVHTLLQDSFGFLWVGTQDGLNRYDGHTFTIFRPDPDDSNTISARWISSLYEDKQGYLWVGTHFGGINRYDPESGTFTHFLHSPDNPKSLGSNRVSAILEDSRGNFWIGTNNGLDQFDRESGEFEHFRHTPNIPSSLSNDNVTVLYEDSRGTLWVGTSQGGLNRFNAASSSFVSYRFSPWDSIGHNSIRAILEESPEVLWVATDQGLVRFNTTSGIFTRYSHKEDNPASIADNAIFSLYMDEANTLWVGTSSGLDLYQPETKSFIHYQHDISNPFSLSDDNITTIYEDKGGVLWFGTFGAGLNRYNREQRNFAYYHTETGNSNSLSSSYIFPIAADQEGRVWIGTSNKGLNRFTPDIDEFVHYQQDPENPESLPSNDISALYVDKAGHIWIGSSAGLSRLNSDTEKFEHYFHDEENPTSLIGERVYAISGDSTNHLWIGTNQGLNKFNPFTEEFVHFQTDSTDPNSLSHNAVSAILEDQHGTLWVGTFLGGLNRYDKQSNSFIRYQHDQKNSESLTHDLVTSIYEDSQKRLWIATGGGGLNLYNREKDSFTHYIEKDGLPNSFVYGIVEDKEANLWLSTNYGISRFEPETESFRNYTASDGLQSNEFNMNAYASDKDGNLYFGGINGLNIFNPENIQDNTYVPPVVLTSFLQGGLPSLNQPQAELIEEVRLVWPENDFSFGFSALSYAQSAQNQHAYILENFDSDWNYIGTRREGRYTNLPGGTYTLKLKGSNSDGVWNENGQSVRIIVIPPFWQTWTFRILALVSLLGLGLIANRLRTQNVRNKNQKLEELVHERTSSLQKRTDEIEALYSGNEKIIRALSLEQIFQSIVEVAVNILHADRSVMFIWDDNKKQVIPRVSHGFASETLDVLALFKGEGFIGQVLETKEALVVSDFDLTTLKPKTKAAIEAEGIRSFLHLPIIVNDKILGIFNISFTRPEAITDDTVKLFTTLVQQAELAIENMALFEKTKEVAVIEERNRVARELHDSAKQKAFAALAQLGAVNGIVDHNLAVAKGHLFEAENLVYDVLQELTFLIQEMYPMALKEKGLATLLREYVFEWKNRNDVMANLEIKNDIPMPLEVEQAIYRMVQEALANVSRHSKASQVDILLNFDAENLIMTIEDNGQGFDITVNDNGMGLRTITERAEGIGGRASIQSEAGNGTTIFVELPLNHNL
ncbi:MAG: GAF domain-containing protein [Chloroflexi bacterium]|nr:GAF domain-containing protein [Chloroflexota bacterium]